MDSMNTKKNNATTWNKGLDNHVKHDRSRLITKVERDHKSMIFSMPKNTHDKKNHNLLLCRCISIIIP
jgi:hypothetical protein